MESRHIRRVINTANHRGGIHKSIYFFLRYRALSSRKGHFLSLGYTGSFIYQSSTPAFPALHKRMLLFPGKLYYFSHSMKDKGLTPTTDSPVRAARVPGGYIRE